MSNILNIGYTGLKASKKSLETAGHNLANVNTEGYSRQRVEQTTNTPITKSGIVSGTGSRVVGIRRINDQFVEKRLGKATSDNEFFNSKSTRLANVEEIFNEINGDGLNQILNRFYNTFRELANQPENETLRSVVRDTAALVVKDFKRIRSSLDEQARAIDSKLRTEVKDINQVLHRIAGINKKIALLEASDQETGDLRDQRDLAVRSLTKSFQVTTYLDEKNQYVVNAQGVGTLVSGVEVQEFGLGSVSENNSKNKMADSKEIFFKARPTLPVTPKFRGGRLAALYETKTKDIYNLQTKIDEIAYEFINTTNAIHRRGFVNREISVDQQGNPDVIDRKGATTGINFFKEPTDQFAAARNIDLSDEVKDDLSNIITSLGPNSPGDNRVAIAISKLQHEKIMADGTATLEEGFLQTVGNIGLEAGKANLDSEQAQGILAQTENLRDRISGVSIDEETQALVRYQHAYEASAKVMATANEMFQTVLGIKR